MEKLWGSSGEIPYPASPLSQECHSKGQTIAVLRAQKLVVVRFGMMYDDNWGMEDFLAEVLSAIK